MRISSLILGASFVWGASFASAMASVVGTNPPSLPLTLQRIQTLPTSQQAPWMRYLEKSKRQMQIDKKTLQAERTKAGTTSTLLSPQVGNARSIPLDKDASWYASADAAHIADVVLSFQTPAGGWSKNLDMSKVPRQPGQDYASGPDRTLTLATPGDYGRVSNGPPSDAGWSWVGTFDNDATTTQLRFLAKVVAALGPTSPNAASYRKSFLHGLDYLLAAQYPNGGWPQIWPLAGGYHDGVTYNDNAMIHVVELFQDAAAGHGEFAFVPTDVRRRAERSAQRGIECILATQIVVKGRRTGWCQQYDPLTLRPTSARNYEMPSESAAESANLVLFLMDLPHPTAAEINAIRGGGAWLAKVAIADSAWRTTPSGRYLVPSHGASLVWARFYEIGTDRPLFGDRDKSIHDKVTEISAERRNGYSWYNSTPQRAVTQYAEWRKEHLAGILAH